MLLSELADGWTCPGCTLHSPVTRCALTSANRLPAGRSAGWRCSATFAQPEGSATKQMFVHLACKCMQKTQNLRKFSYTKISSGQPLDPAQVNYSHGWHVRICAHEKRP